MKKLLIVLALALTTAMYSSPINAAQQQINGYVSSVLFNSATQSGIDPSNFISISGYSGQNPTTTDRELGKMALLAKLSGSSVMIIFDPSLPYLNNVISVTVLP